MEPASSCARDPLAAPAGWQEPTWFDRLAACLRARLLPGADPWTAALAGFAVLHLLAGLGAWLWALGQGEGRWAALFVWAAFSLLAVRDLARLEARLRPRPLPRIGDRPGAARDPGFWRALRRAGVNVRIARALHAGGIQGAEDVRRRSDAELLAIPGVGPRTVERLRRVLADQEEAAP